MGCASAVPPRQALRLPAEQERLSTSKYDFRFTLFYQIFGSGFFCLGGDGVQGPIEKAKWASQVLALRAVFFRQPWEQERHSTSGYDVRSTIFLARGEEMTCHVL